MSSKFNDKIIIYLSGNEIAWKQKVRTLSTWVIVRKVLIYCIIRLPGVENVETD